MVSAVSAVRELKPVPVITTVSSGDAVAGSIVSEALGTSNAVVVPEMVPTVATTILEPGVRDPPVAAPGISVIVVKPPRASVKNPPWGIPLAPPKVKTTPVVFGGKLLPVTVTIPPVEAEAGSTTTVPAGTVSLASATLFAVASPFNALALSVAVSVRVPTAAANGTAIVPVPEPSEPIGKRTVPASVPALIVMVNEAVVEFSRLSTVIPVTVTVTESPGAAVDGDNVRVLAVLVNPLDLPTRPVVSVAVTV
jgi:hypothetical protein